MLCPSHRIRQNPRTVNHDLVENDESGPVFTKNITLAGIPAIIAGIVI